MALIDDATGVVESIASHVEFTKEYEQVGLENPVWVNLSEVLEKLTANYEFKRIHINSSINRNLYVFSDGMIDKVLYNIFENSLRHGGDVTEIGISFERCENEGILTIRDNGLGVLPDIKFRIFEEGYGDNTGFGLFIIKSILEITGIKIRETGVYGEGASFEILIPSENYYFK